VRTDAPPSWHQSDRRSRVRAESNQVVLWRRRHTHRQNFLARFPTPYCYARLRIADNSGVWTLGGPGRTVSGVSVAPLRIWLTVGFIGAIAILLGPATPTLASPGPGVLTVRPAATFTCNLECTISVVITLTNQTGTAAIVAYKPTIRATEGEAQGEIVGPGQSSDVIQPRYNQQWKVDFTASRLPATIIISASYMDAETKVHSDSQAEIYITPITSSNTTPIASSNTPWPEEWGGEIGAAVALLAVLLGYSVARRTDFISWRRDTKHKTYASLLAWIQEFRNVAFTDFSAGLIPGTAKAPQIRDLIDEKRAELQLLSASSGVISKFEAAGRQMTKLDGVLTSHNEEIANHPASMPEAGADPLWTNYNNEFADVVKEFLDDAQNDLIRDEQRSLWRRRRESVTDGSGRELRAPLA
jgi:hypothetical protein